MAVFTNNLLLFSFLLFALGIFTRQENFAGNFLNALLLGQALNLFDLLVIDLIWWRHTQRVRFTGTEISRSCTLIRESTFHLFCVEL